MMQPPTKKVKYKGVVLKLYGVGWLALLCSRSTCQVRTWERLGYLPRPLLSAKGDRRYYTVAELMGYSEIYKRSKVRRHVATTATRFQMDCATLQNHLRTAMTSDPKVLGVSMNDNELKELSLAKHQRRIASEIERIKTGKTNVLTGRHEVL